jgi:membrane peptidoglycan carboxypeptidase
MGSPGKTQRPMTNVGGITVYGGTYPAMIWGAYMKVVESGRPVQRFVAPDALTTRQPRQLLLADELPASTRTNDSSGFSSPAPEVGGGAGGGGGSTTTVGPRNGPTTIFDPFGGIDDPADDTPRTTRTSRPPRPRDITTVPP